MYAIQGPDRFWECNVLGASTVCHDIVATTWPERQRILDMVADDGPWVRIESRAFKARWKHGNCSMSATDSEPFHIREHVELAAHTTFGIKAQARWFAEVQSVDALRAP